MVFITAEIGINHNGNINLAKKLIDNAVKAGCDGVKFQKRNIDKVYTKAYLDSHRESPWGNTQRAQKLGLEFSEKQYEKIDEYCKKKKLSGMYHVGIFLVKSKCENLELSIIKLHQQ